jgi:hypothetical protein
MRTECATSNFCSSASQDKGGIAVIIEVMVAKAVAADVACRSQFWPADVGRRPIEAVFEIWEIQRILPALACFPIPHAADWLNSLEFR